eukprot:scaffold232271_cov42-Cyclotella_meneghiniana.AAC.1
MFRLFELEFLNPFELRSIGSDSGSVKGGKFVSVHEKSNNLVAFNGAQHHPASDEEIILNCT